MSKQRIYQKFKIKVLPVKGIEFQDEDAFNAHLIPLMDEEKWYELTIKPIARDRSRQEEKYYRAVVCRLVGEAMSITVDEAHEFMARLFLTVIERRTLPDGTVVRYERVRSSTELTHEQFDDYVFKDCVPWASLPTLDDGLNRQSGLELFIPLPNEVEYDY